MAYQLPPFVWPSTLLAVCALALWRGGRDERMAAAIVAADWVATVAVFEARSEVTQWPVMAFDVAQLALLGSIALRSRRHWPLAAAALALLEVATHLAHALDPRVSGWAYQTLELVWSYLCLGVIAHGAISSRRWRAA